MGRRLALLLVSAIALSPAWAQEAPIPNDRPSWDPPARFDHPYKGQLVERRLPQKQVVASCRALVRDYGRKYVIGNAQRGCSVVEGSRCIVVYIDRPYGLAAPEAVRRHEIGHCNGWPSSHPD